MPLSPFGGHHHHDLKNERRKTMETIIINGVTCILSTKTADQYRRECEEIEAENRRPLEMLRLVRAWLVDGDEMAGDIWSDLWKDEYGCRPRYSRDELRRMYGL